MHNKQLNDLIAQLKPSSERIIEVLDAVKDYIADARNGDYSTEARKSAIEAIDKVFYNKIKGDSKKDKPEEENWI